MFVVSYNNGVDRVEANFTGGERETAHEFAKQKAGRHYHASVLYYDGSAHLDGSYDRGAGGIVRQTGGSYGKRVLKGRFAVAV